MSTTIKLRDLTQVVHVLGKVEVPEGAEYAALLRDSQGEIEVRLDHNENVTISRVEVSA